MENLNKLCSQRLYEALVDIRMKPSELSKRSGVRESSISQYLSGYHKPSNITAKKMSFVLGVSPIWLMGFDAPKYLTLEDNQIQNREIIRLANYIAENPKGETITKLLSIINEMTEEQIEMLYGMAKVIKPE